MPQPRRHANRTLLIVGEGDTEIAFLSHLKALYVLRYCGLTVTVRNAHGKGPANVVKAVMRYSRDRDFTQKAALLDTDLPWPDETRALAARKRIILLGCTPCIEGMLLSVLGRPVPDVPADCKRAFFAAVGRDGLRQDDYVGTFNRGVLEGAKGRISTLRQLLALLI